MTKVTKISSSFLPFKDHFKKTNLSQAKKTTRKKTEKEPAKESQTTKTRLLGWA